MNRVARAVRSGQPWQPPDIVQDVILETPAIVEPAVCHIFGPVFQLKVACDDGMDRQLFARADIASGQALELLAPLGLPQSVPQWGLGHELPREMASHSTGCHGRRGKDRSPAKIRLDKI